MSKAAALAERASSSTPDVSLSSRWTSRGRSPSKASASSMPSRCCAVFEPPCTASPAGLSMTMTCASRCSTRARRSSAAPTARSCAGRAVAGGRSLDQRRHPNLLAWLQPFAGAGAAAVDAYLAGAQQPLQQAVGHGGPMAAEPAVKPQPALVGSDFDRLGASPLMLLRPRDRLTRRSPGRRSPPAGAVCAHSCSLRARSLSQ